MNVVLNIIFVLEIIIAFTRAEAFSNWNWAGRNKYKHWSHHHSETYHSCTTGHCLKEWNCPKAAVVAASEKDSCVHWNNGPWVCCLVDGSNFHHQEGTYTSETPSNFKPTTIEKSKYDRTAKPLLKDSWNRNAKEEFPRNRPLGDILKNNRENYPFYKPKNKTTGTKAPDSASNNKSTSNTDYKRTTASWDKSRNSTLSPNYYKRTTNSWNKPRTSTPNTNDKKTTNLWDKSRTIESRIIFPTERAIKYTTSSSSTKRISNNESPNRSGNRATPTKSSWRYSTASYTRTVSTTTKRPYSKKPTVSNKATTEARNQISTSAYPARSQTTKPKTTARPGFVRSSTKITRRYSVTTPLPNVNIRLCGIRDERTTTTRRQTRDSNNGSNPITGTGYAGNTRSRSRLPYERIVGGREAEPFSWPWVAALYKVTSSGGNRFLSAGTLINENFILTAAHVFTPDDLRTASYVVMLGTHDAQDSVAQYIVSSVLLHPQYEHRYYYNDIALLQLERKVYFNNYIMPICLPSSIAPLHADDDLLGKNVTVMGWGDDSFGGKSSQVLKEASFPIVSRASCNASYVRVASNRFPKGITADMLCAGDPKGGKDACQGDSGGPLTVTVNGRYTQVGIVSFGYKCGDREFPGVYTKVAPYLSWIAQNTKYVDDYTDY